MRTAPVTGRHQYDTVEGVRRNGHRSAGRPEGEMPERESRPGAGDKDPDVEAVRAVLAAADIHTVRRAVERLARTPPPAFDVHTDRRPAGNGRVQLAQRVLLALVARRGRHFRVPGARAHRVPHMLRGRRHVLHGRHHPDRGPDQAHRAAHVALLHRHAGGRGLRRLPERQHRLLRHVRRVHGDERPGAVARCPAGQGHIRAVRKVVRVADHQSQGDRRLRARAGQETAQQVTAHIHDSHIAAHRRTHARLVCTNGLN